MGRRNQSVDQPIAGTIRPPVKTGVTLSAEAHHRLATAVLVERKTMSQIVERLIQTHLTGYYSGRRGHAEAGDAEEVA